MKAYFIILVLLGVSIIPVFAMPGFQPVYQSPSLANGSPPTELYCTLGQFLNSYNSTTNSFTCLAGGGGGENNTASNVGLGEDIFKQKTGVDFEFKGIAVSGDLSISSNLTDITISYTGGTGNMTILNDAGDVVLTSPAYPSILFYNGLQWIDKIFSINSLSSANDIFVTGINNQTGTINTNQFSVNTITCSGTNKISAIDNVTGSDTCSTDQSGSGGAPRGGYLMATWSQSMTKTNIGTSFVDVYTQTASNGKAILIDSDTFTEVRLYI